MFIIAVEENILPHQRCKDDPLAIEEERRLLFVGITRARDLLQLSYARRRSFRDTESPGIPQFILNGTAARRHAMAGPDRTRPILG